MADPTKNQTTSEPAHRQIARSIRNQILAGVLRDGQVLASSRALAEEWSVSVHTVSEAMKILMAEKLVATQDRSKRVVTAPSTVSSTGVQLLTPTAILVGGYAGSGKSEFARLLARETGWGVIDKDTVSRPLAEEALISLGQSPNDRESGTYLEKIRPYEYEALANAVNENLQCGSSVIATAPYLKEFGDDNWLERTIDSHTSLGARTEIVWIYCDVESMHRYLRQRGAARDNYKFENWEDYIKQIDIKNRPLVSHSVVDNSSTGSSLRSQAHDLIVRLSANAIKQ